MYPAYDRLLKRLSPGWGRSTLVLLVNWIHQGFLSLGRTDKIGKIIVEGGLVATAFLLLTSGTALALIPSVALSLVIAHTGNWILNTNVHATRRAGGRFHTSEARLRKALGSLEHRLRRARIAGALLGGSALWGGWGPTSDLDVHVVRRPGVRGVLGGLWAVLKERSRAFFTRIPLDIYLEDPAGARLTAVATASGIIVGDHTFHRALVDAQISTRDRHEEAGR